MIGALKAPAGGFGITSLPRTEAPATSTPETSKPAEQTQTSGRGDNPVLRSLTTDGFEGHGARGRSLGLGHLKRAARAEKATEGKAQEALQKLIDDLSKLVEQLLAQLGQKPQQAPTTPGNTGIVPPNVVQGSPTPGNTGIVPPGNTGIVPPSVSSEI
jgi:hypothetical protein